MLVSPATEMLINFFWLHWINLGIVWGLIIAAAVTIWLRVLAVPSAAFCFMVWLSGAGVGRDVGPLWAVMFLAAAAAVLN